jgi:type II secretory pathway component PulK
MIYAPKAKRRCGITLVIALALMGTLTVIFAVLTVQIVSQHRMLALRQRQMQATWLARSGVELAVARLLEKSGDFVDEKQDLLPDAKVRFEIKEAEAKGTYLVTVEVQLGAEDEKPVVSTATRRIRRVQADGMVRVENMGTDQ